MSIETENIVARKITSNEVKHYKLGELSDVVRGSSPRPQGDARYYGGTVPRLMVSDLTRDGMYVTPQIDSLTEKGAELSRPMKKGDVVIAVSGNPGLPSILNSDACIHDGFVGLRNLDSTKIYNEYLYYFLLFNKLETKSKAVGAIFKNLTTDQIKEIEIPLPELKGQKEIAQVLEQADKARQQRKAANALTDQFLQSSFLSLFGDPVKNEKDWGLKNIGDLTTLVSSGSTPLGGQSVYSDKGITFIRSQNILMNEIDYSDVVFISEDIHSKMKRTWVKKNDVLLNITGASIGRLAYFEGDDDSANVNQHVCIIRLRREKALPEFISYLISNNSYQNQILSQNSGATRQAFNFEQIKNFNIIFPPLSLQQQFAGIVAQTEQLRQKQRESERELENLFQGLLQRYFG